jgi:phosphoribosylaminoimidazole-succinocarboxamide synthase
MLATTLFSVALTVPMFTATAASAADDAVSPRKATTQIGNSQVQSVRAMTERITDILDEFGAGHARPIAAAFW